MSVLRLLEEAAEGRPQSGFTFLRGGRTVDVLSYEHLAQTARQVAVGLRQRGARRGQRALLVFGPGLDFLRAFWGCLYAGLIPVPAPAPNPWRLQRTRDRLAAIARDCQARWLLTDQESLEVAGPGSVWRLPQLLGEASLWKAPAPALGDLAVLQYTSGSTRDPRGVRLTHANLRHNLAMLGEFLAPATEVVMVHWLPLFHDMGLIRGMLSPLHLQGSCSMLDPWEFIQSPGRWLQALSEQRATVTGAPSFGFAVAAEKLARAPLPRWDLSSLRLAFCSAEPIQVDALRRFAELLKPCGLDPRALRPSYGLAEATVMVAAETRAGMTTRRLSRRALGSGRLEAPEEPEDTKELACCGQVLGGQRAVIVDSEGRPCPAGQVGEIWLAGPSVAAGYWRQKRLSRRVFGAHLADGQGPFLRTGDLGWLDDEGGLTVCGRLKDLLIVRGENLYPQDLECWLEAEVAGLRSGCSAVFAGCEEEVVVVAESQSPSPELAETVMRAARRWGVSVARVVCLGPGELPKTASGKRQRVRAAELYRQGVWQSRPGWP